MLYALYQTYNGVSGKLYTDHFERVVVARTTNELWSLRMLASSLRSESSGYVYEVTLPADWNHSVVLVTQVA